MKKLVMPVLFVWIAGALLASMYYDVQRKANCIEQEGFLKGWLWCKTDPITRMEFSNNRIELFVKGLGWPLRILRAVTLGFRAPLKQDTCTSMCRQQNLP